MAQEPEATTHDESIPAVNPGGASREDDRNEEVAGSPVPDPTETSDAADVPGAD